MKKTGLIRDVCIVAFVVATLMSVAYSQNPLQQKIAALKEASAQDKQALAQYTWVEQVTISLKGEQKKQEHFQVRLGPDGKPQKTSMDAPADPASANSGRGRRQGRLKEHVVEKKKEEYKDYADQIKTLVQQYVPPDKDKLQQAFAQGNITLGTVPGATGEASLVISNYVKPGDKMTIVINGKDVSSVSIASYLDDPKDAVNDTVQFTRIPGGPNHVSSQTINGVSKQLTIAIQNTNYQKL